MLAQSLRYIPGLFLIIFLNVSLWAQEVKVPVDTIKGSSIVKVEEWIPMVQESGKLFPYFVGKRELTFMADDSLRLTIKKSSAAGPLRMKILQGGSEILNEQSIKGTEVVGPFNFNVAGGAPVEFRFRKSHLEQEEFTISIEKYRSYEYEHSTDTINFEYQPAPGVDTAATLLLEQTVSIAPREFGQVGIELLDFSEIAQEFDYWVYFIGYGDQVGESLQQFTGQISNTTGDAITDYGLMNCSYLPEFAGEKSAFQFKNTLDMDRLRLPNADVQPNILPSKLEKELSQEYYGIVKSSVLPNYLYLFNYASYRNQSVYIKLVGFKSLTP